MEYFDITSFETPYSVELKEEYWLLDFEEKNQIPNGHEVKDYESRGFMESKSIQVFPLRGKAVYLRIKNVGGATNKREP